MTAGRSAGVPEIVTLSIIQDFGFASFSAAETVVVPDDAQPSCAPTAFL